MSYTDEFNTHPLSRTTPAFFVKASQVTNATTLAAQTVVDTYDIEVTDATGINQFDYLGIFNTNTKRFYQGVVLSISSNTLTMDRWMDSVFEIGDVVGTGFTNMAVDGSATPQIFTVRGADPGVDLTIDITRILFKCITTNALDLTQFGDGLALVRGFLIRTTDGSTYNQVLFKTNIEMKGWMLDWESLDDSNPGQGLHGFVGRLTYGSKGKIDTVVRLAAGEELQFIIQDNMTLRCLSLEVMTEGSEVPENEL